MARCDEGVGNRRPPDRLAAHFDSRPDNRVRVERNAQLAESGDDLPHPVEAELSAVRRETSCSSAASD